jgi:beta-1,2-mannobiose phosphorylase / 1,2-beta-oligomannan phosphorylase
MSAWIKHPGNPVLGPGYTVSACFDSCVLVEGALLRMWFSWRDLASIAYCESNDGVHWTPPRVVLEYDPRITWEKSCINRPHVLRAGGSYYMWYTAQNFEAQTSVFSLATSQDGFAWERVGSQPVLRPAGGWEKGSLMCPHVLYEKGSFRMWYSGGELYEADAVGYAESPDGIHWQRELTNPVLRPTGGWECDRITAACILPRQEDYLAFYIGFGEGYERSQIGLARSVDGIHRWERYPHNPIVAPGPAGSWDDCNVYKPYVVPFGGLWYMWYNASRCRDRREQIGLATATEIDF